MSSGAIQLMVTEEMSKQINLKVRGALGGPACMYEIIIFPI